MFELKVGSSTYPLKWGFWAMREFTRQTGKTTQDYFNMLGDGQAILDNIETLLHIAAKYANPALQVSVQEVCEWIDGSGGIIGNAQINGFIQYIVGTHIVNASEKPAEPTEEEKKS